MISTSRPRKIIHVDMDAFYASVEQRDHPELRGKPVVVGGSPKGRGVVATASYEARKFGIRSAMSSAQAYRRCPQAIFVHSDFKKYKEASKIIREVFHQVTDKVEPLSLDEAYLDVTENHLGMDSATEIARWIKREIQEKTQLTASAGVSMNKFLAKVASDYKKPDGLFVIRPKEAITFIASLPIERFWGVGKSTSKKLRSLGFHSGADLQKCSKDELGQKLGKMGHFLWQLAQAQDSREVKSERVRKSYGSENTLRYDVLDADHLIKVLESHSDQITGLMKKQDKRGRTISVKIKYANFQSITRSKTLMFPTNDAKQVHKISKELLFDRTEVGERPVRLVGLSVSNIYDPQELVQLEFDFSIISDK